MDSDALFKMLDARTYQRAEILKMDIDATFLKREGAWFAYKVMAPDAKPLNIQKLREAGVGWAWELFLHHGTVVDYRVFGPKEES